MNQNSENEADVVESGLPNSQTTKDKLQDSSQAKQEQENFADRIKRIEGMVELMQSNKDKGVNKALSEVGEMRKTLSEVQQLMKKGLSEEEAFDSIEAKKSDNEFKSAVLELRDYLKSGNSLPVQAGGATEKANGVDVSQYDLDPNDPDVVQKVLSLTDPKEAELAALKLAFNRQKQQPSASAVSGVVSKPAPVQDESSKIARLTELQKTPSKHKTEIDKLTKELGW